jgi:acyl carrier protein
MTNEDILERVCKAFASVIGDAPAEKVVPGATMEDVEGWDSINFINLVMAIEDEFGIQMSTIEAASLTSVDAVVNFVAGKG